MVACEACIFEARVRLLLSAHLFWKFIMKKEFYTQCRLVSGTLQTTAFIPTKFAVVNKALLIKGEDWTVSEVFETVEYADIKDQQHNSGDIWSATSGSVIVGHK